MSLKARTPIIEYDECFAIELCKDVSSEERDRLTDQAMVIAYDRLSRSPPRWRLRAIFFDRGAWTRSGIRRWWAAHEIRFLATERPQELVPEICRAYSAPSSTLPTILLCHRNTPMSPAHLQIAALRAGVQPTHSEDAKA